MDKCIQKTLCAFTAFVVLSACGEEKLTPTPTPGSKEIIVLSELVNPIIFTSDGGTETIDFRAPDSWTAGIINGKRILGAQSSRHRAGLVKEVSASHAQRMTYLKKDMLLFILRAGTKQSISM